MTRPAVVLRPAPGDAATAARLEALGLRVIRLPLFAVRPIAWTAPPLDGVDAILFTSANAIRHGGTGLAALKHLPVVAVGGATARAAREAGFTLALNGDGDAMAAASAARTEGFVRLLHLGGRERIDVPGSTSITVYASDPVDLPETASAQLRGSVILLHSPRAARLIGRLVVDRTTTRVAALSPAVAAAAETGWDHLAAADTPTDVALVALAHRLAIDP